MPGPRRAIVGLLPAIEFEPDKVGIRTATGLEWSYPAELESDMLTLIGSRVWVRGTGRTTSARGGALEIAEIRRRRSRRTQRSKIFITSSP